MSKYIIAAFLSIALSSDATPLPAPPAQYEFDLLHPKERYGACWQYCKDDIMYTSTIINILFDKAQQQEKEIKELRKLLQIYQSGKEPPKPTMSIDPYIGD